MSNVVLENISKSYGKKKVLDNISVTFEEGKIYGLLGRNGVGKTTLLNIANCRELPDGGRVLINGKEVWESDNILSKLYFMSEKNMFDESIKIKDIFKWTNEFRENFDLKYAHYLSDKFQLDINQKFSKLSTGYKTICKIIVTLASGCEILIFDEPVLGLDASHRELFYKELIDYYGKNEPTIILSTHIIEEIANILEKVIIIKDGKVKRNSDVEELLQSAYAVSGKVEAIEEYSKNKNVLATDTLGSFSKVTILGKRKDIDRDEINKLGLEIGKVELQKLFVYITEREEQ